MKNLGFDFTFTLPNLSLSIVFSKVIKSVFCDAPPESMNPLIMSLVTSQGPQNLSKILITTNENYLPTILLYVGAK